MIESDEIDDDCPHDDDLTEENDLIDNTWNGYRLIGDNLDKDVKPRYMRLDRQTQSLHFFHYFAVKDQIDFSKFSDIPNPYLRLPISELPLKLILPSASDHQTLMHNMGILVSRILVEELAYFNSTFEDVVIKHITHVYYKEMGTKSNTVS